MKINFNDYSRPSPREMSDDEIDVISTSAKTANASAIILKKTDSLQTKFEPSLIDNEKDPNKSVSGKLIYERKKQNDTEFPSEKITRRSVKSGELIELSLNTSETYNLFIGLQKLYELYNDIGHTPSGSTTYTKIGTNFKQFKTIIETNPSAAQLLGQPDNFDLVKILLQIITNTDSLDTLKNGLKSLAETNVTSLTYALSIERLDRVCTEIENNINNSNEEYWQKLLAENQWLISQLFSFPCTIFEEKAYLGGKNISNSGGNVCDFIYCNDLTQNIAIVEIKTPCAKIIGNEYRSTYSFSQDMSGAINQALNYRDKLTKEFYTNVHNSNKKYQVLNPKCLVLIGKIDGLNDSQISALENFRNSMNNILIITFDELLGKIKNIIAIFKSNDINETVDFEDELSF